MEEKQKVLHGILKKQRKKIKEKKNKKIKNS